MVNVKRDQAKLHIAWPRLGWERSWEDFLKGALYKTWALRKQDHSRIGPFLNKTSLKEEHSLNRQNSIQNTINADQFRYALCQSRARNWGVGPTK